MDAQPPEDYSALARAVLELQAQMAEMKKQLAELTRNPHQGYIEKTRDYNPEPADEEGVNLPLLNDYIQQHGRDKDNPPNIPHIMLLKCVRCEHLWRPRTSSPKKCPSCKSPWWFMPRWRWAAKEGSKTSV